MGPAAVLGREVLPLPGLCGAESARL